MQDLILFFKVNESLMHLSQFLHIKSYFSLSETVSFHRMSKHAAWLTTLISLGWSERTTGDSPVGILTDVSTRERFSLFSLSYKLSTQYYFRLMRCGICCVSLTFRWFRLHIMGFVLADFTGILVGI